MLYGKSAMGARESLLTFIGPDLVAARWKQWRFYFKDMHLTGTGSKCSAGSTSSSSIVFPEGLQHRDGPARGFEPRRHHLFMAAPVYQAWRNIRSRSRSIPTRRRQLTNFRETKRVIHTMPMTKREIEGLPEAAEYSGDGCDRAGWESSRGSGLVRMESGSRDPVHGSRLLQAQVPAA